MLGHKRISKRRSLPLTSAYPSRYVYWGKRHDPLGGVRRSVWWRLLHSLLFSLALAVSGLGVAWIVGRTPQPALAVDQPNPSLSFQGKLTSPTTSAAVTDGAYDVAFSIYSTSTGGTPLWSEAWRTSTMFGTTVAAQAATGSAMLSYTNDASEANVYVYQTLYNVTRRDQVTILAVNAAANTVSVSPTAKTWESGDTITTRVSTFGGLFSVRLPATTTLETIFNVASSTRLYLGVAVGTDAEMEPRKLIAFAPFAINSLYLGGVASTSFARLDLPNTFTAVNTFTANTTVSNAQLTVARTDPGLGYENAALRVDLSSVGAATNQPGIAITYDNGLGGGAMEVLRIDSEGDVFISGTYTGLALQGLASAPLNLYGGTGQYVLVGSALPAAYVGLVATSTDDLFVADELYVDGLARFGGNIHSSGTLAVSGLASFIGAPVGMGVGQGSLYVNPLSATANYTLLGAAVNGTQKFRVDAEGDVTAALGSFTDVTVSSLTGGQVIASYGTGGVGVASSQIIARTKFSSLPANSSMLSIYDTNSAAVPFRVDVNGNVFASGTFTGVGLTTTSTVPLKVYGGNSTGYVQLGLALPAAYTGLLVTSTDDLFVVDELYVDGLARFGGNIHSSGTLAVTSNAYLYASTTFGSANSGALVGAQGEWISNTTNGQFLFTTTGESSNGRLVIDVVETNNNVNLDNPLGSYILFSDNVYVTASGRGLVVSNGSGISNGGTVDGIEFRDDENANAPGNVAFELNYAFPIIYSASTSVATTSIYDTLLVSSTGGIFLRDLVNASHVAASIDLDDTNDELLIDVNTSSTLVTQLDVAVRLDDNAGASYFRIRDSDNAAVWSVDSNGTIGTGGSDLAERYPSLEALTPGDVVVVDSGHPGYVRRSTGITGEVLLGAITTRPAMIMGFYGEPGYDVALAGRVPVKASAVNGPIGSGDLLTAAPSPGVAMRRIESGPVLGVALTPLAEGEGTVETFISLAYAPPPSALAERDDELPPLLPADLALLGAPTQTFSGDLTFGDSSADRLTLNATVLAGDRTGRAISLSVGSGQVGLRQEVLASLANASAIGSLTVAGTALNGTSEAAVGHVVQLRAEDIDDAAYGYRVVSNGGAGTQYGLVVDLAAGIGPRWSIYVTPGGGRAYLGDGLAVGAEQERIVDPEFHLGSRDLYVDDQLGVAGVAYFNDSVRISGLAYLGGGTGWRQGDFAERLALREGSAEPGAVVVADRENGGGRLSWRPNAPDVIGVVSADSAGILRHDGVGVPVALVGTVPVRVTGENGPVQRGDALTTASRPGYAMRATVADAGTIGVALSEAGVGGPDEEAEVEVLLALSRSAARPVTYGLSLDDLSSSDALDVSRLLDEPAEVEVMGEPPLDGEVVVAARQQTAFAGDLRVGGLALIGGTLVARTATVPGDVTVYGTIRAQANLALAGALTTEFWDASGGQLQLGDAVTVVGPDEVDVTWADLVPPPANSPDPSPVFRPAIGLAVGFATGTALSARQVEAYVAAAAERGVTVDPATVRRVQVAFGGTVGGLSGLEPGRRYFLAVRPLELDGRGVGQSLTSAAPTEVGYARQILGVARSSSTVLLNPSLSYELSGDSEEVTPRYVPVVPSLSSDQPTLPKPEPAAELTPTEDVVPEPAAAGELVNPAEAEAPPVAPAAEDGT